MRKSTLLLVPHRIWKVVAKLEFIHLGGSHGSALQIVLMS